MKNNENGKTALQEQKDEKPAYHAPEVTVLDVEETATGPFPDPTEFPGILQMS